MLKRSFKYICHISRVIISPVVFPHPLPVRPPPPAIISNELRSEKASDTNTNPVWEVSAVMQAWFPIKTSAWRVIKCDKKVFFLFFFPQG